MLVLFLHGPLSVSRRILLMKAIRTYYKGVELGSFVGLFLVFTRALYELLAKRKKKLLFLDQQRYVLYYHILDQNFETNRLDCYYCIMASMIHTIWRSSLERVSTLLDSFDSLNLSKFKL